MYLKNIITGIKVGYIIHPRLKLQDLRHIKINEKSFFIFQKKVETFPPLQLWVWEPFQVGTSWVGTFPGGNFSGIPHADLQILFSSFQ